MIFLTPAFFRPSVVCGASIKIVYDYNADNFDHSDLDFIGGSQLYSEPCEREPVNSVDALKDKEGRAWGAEWKDQIRKNWDSYAQIVTEGEGDKAKATEIRVFQFGGKKKDAQ